MPEEAKARGHALDMLTSGRGPERYRGESEATSQHTGSQDPDGGLARHPLEERPAPCLPPPQANVPSHATWRGQNSTQAPKPAKQVLVCTAVSGASGDPRQSREAHRGHRWGESLHLPNDGDSLASSVSMATRPRFDARGFPNVAALRSGRWGFQPNTKGRGRRLYARPWSRSGKPNWRPTPRAFAQVVPVGRPSRRSFSASHVGRSTC